MSAGRARVAVLLALFACGGEPPANDPAPREEQPARVDAPSAIRFPGGPVEPSAFGADQDLRVFEPYEEREVTFRAAPARTILDAHLPGWRDADEVVFECADGYRAAVPVARLLGHAPYLATARDGAEFTIDKPVGGAVVETALAPAYLVWENLGDEVVRSEGDWGWPYQIVGVSVADARERYARMTPPRDAGESVERGFTAFRRWCARCHAINGQGGEVGPELNVPASVTEYIEPTWLRRWIGEPQSVRRGTPMPGLPSGVPERERTIEDLVAYLEAMAERKL